jgi:ABC-2 type transport system ATP-binding protein
MNSVIELDRISKSFGATQALKNLSLQIPEGTIFGLLGENGAGKSTAIRILLGMERPDAGSSTVLGLSSQRQGLAIRRKVGYVPERPVLYDWMTIDELGWFTGGFYENHDTVIANYSRIARDFGLDVKQKIGGLSKGQTAKVALTLALAHDPKVLILDEPTSGLDTMVRREFLDSMVEMAASGRTVLISSHQIGEIERIADYVAIISQGQLVTVDRLDELKSSMRQFTITCESESTPAPSFNGQLISKAQRGRQWSLLLRNSGADLAQRIQEHAGVLEVHESKPTLEDIYLALMTGQARIATSRVE